MRDKMFKYFSANSTKKYIVVLDALVDQYNNKVHSSIKMTHTEASLKKKENKVWRNIVPKFSIRDNVRITRKKGTFEKGYTPRLTKEVFTVSRIQDTDPPTYKITDCNDEKIQGTFYELELKNTTQDIFRIEKVIRKRG